jgi:hypothetical protein
MWSAMSGRRIRRQLRPRNRLSQAAAEKLSERLTCFSICMHINVDTVIVCLCTDFNRSILGFSMNSNDIIFELNVCDSTENALHWFRIAENTSRLTTTGWSHHSFKVWNWQLLYLTWILMKQCFMCWKIWKCRRGDCERTINVGARIRNAEVMADRWRQ